MPRLEDVVHLVPEGIGARLTLAECYEASGRLASAWKTYAHAEAEAARTKQRAREKEAHARAEKLRHELAQLAIVVPDAVRALPGLVIERDGVAVGEAEWGVPVPVDKGRHVIVLTAMGKRRAEKTVEIGADGIAETVTIDPPPDLAPSAPPVPSPPSPPPSPGSRPISVAGFIVSGLGFGAGAALVIVAKTKGDDASSKYDALKGMGPNACSGLSPSAACVALHDARMAQGTFANAALWTFVGAGVVTAGTLVYTFAVPRDAPAAKVAGLSAAPVVSPFGGGLLIRGAF